MLALLFEQHGKEKGYEHVIMPWVNNLINKIGPLLFFLVETKPFRKQCCRKQLDLYSNQKEKVIYCIFVLEGLEEFNRQGLWFHKEKPAQLILN